MLCLGSKTQVTADQALGATRVERRIQHQVIFTGGQGNEVLQPPQRLLGRVKARLRYR